MPLQHRPNPLDTRSERIVDALKQLRQFRPAQERERAIHVLSGVTVSPLPDPGREGHGLLQLHFPGGLTEAVIGEDYLQLQMIEHCRLEQDGPEGDGPVAQRVRSLSKKWAQLNEVG